MIQTQTGAPALPETEAATPIPGGLREQLRTSAIDSAEYLADLNAAQREAVLHLDTPLLILAGAGTGKTRVLTRRIAHIIATGRAKPSQILAMTFTNRAAREMRSRIEDYLGPVAASLSWLGTFHANGARMLRYHAENVHLRPDFTILDTDDQLRLIKQIYAAAGLDEKMWPARSLLWRIDHWKNRGLIPQNARERSTDREFLQGRGPELYAQYQSRLQTLNAVDFGDLILLPLQMLRESDEILQRYRTRFRFILVDEYQDTNVAQYLWLRLLAGGNQTKLSCVGDDDQSIYGWRGAEVGNILRFESDFADSRIIKLETNYRSTTPILATASHLIAHNRGRLGKTLRTHATGGPPVIVAGAWDSAEEARNIGEEIESLLAQGHELREMAILVRASSQMREFEERFVATGLPYRVIGGPRFYERKEIADAIAYLRIIHNTADDLALERIINRPRRGVGESSMQKLHHYARTKEVSLLWAARSAREAGVASRAVAPLSHFTRCIDHFRHLNTTLQPFQLVEQVLEDVGYVDMLKADTSPDAQGRLENLKELVRALEPYETLGDFLEHIALVTDAQDDAPEGRVCLMTLHAAKGLEFDTVFLPGWEEGLFPHQRTLDESGAEGLEEERRLGYVGITRARNQVFVWFASSRRTHGRWQQSEPSRFLDELPREHVTLRKIPTRSWHGVAMRNAEPNRPHRPSPIASRESHEFRQAAPPSSRLPNAKPGTAVHYASGERVFHQKFGYGTVVESEGDRLSIRFDHSDLKRLMASFVCPADQV